MAESAMLTDRRKTFTLRAVAIGAALTALYAWMCPMAVYQLFSSRLEQGTLPPGIIALNICVLAANLLVSRFRPRMALGTGELVIIFAMTWMGAVSFQFGFIGNTLSIMSAPEYFASPENRWYEYYIVHLPNWVHPPNRLGAIRYFYNGLPEGQSIPWNVWRVPFIWWGSLIAAILSVVISLMTIIQEQWHDREKLTFPMADIPLALIDHEKPSGWLPAWTRSRAFWTGAAIPFCIIAWNTLNWFDPAFPRITFSQDETSLLLRYWPNFYTKVDFFTIGMAYFAPVQVLQGLWMGRLILGAEMGLGRKFGFGEGLNEGFQPWSDWGTQTAAWQCLGSLTMFVLWGLWMARDHLRRVFSAAFSTPENLPPHLRQRYRTAVWGLIAGLTFVSFWFHEAGMSWSVIVLFLGMFIILTLGMAKVILESSVIMIDGPVSPQTFVLETLGTSHIAQHSMTALVLSYVVIRSQSGMMLAQSSFASRMSDEHGVKRSGLYSALGIAVIVAIIVAVLTTVVLAYKVGAFNFQSHAFRVGHVEAFASLASKSDAQTEPDYFRLTFFGVGMALMYIILLIRTRFANFWLHPIGFTFTSTSVSGLMTINFFLAWLAKTVLGKFGGSALVDRAKPFFLGLVCGHSMGVVLGIVIDAIWFPGQGHRILTGW